MKVWEDYGHLYNYARAFTLDKEEAKELVQDTLIRCFEKNVDLPSQAMRMYSNRVLRSLFIDKKRWEKRLKNSINIPLTFEQIFEIPSNVKESKYEDVRYCEINEYIRIIYNCTERKIQFETFIMYTYFGMSYKQIAEKIKSDTNSVGAHIRYMKIKIKNLNLKLKQ